MNYLLKIITLLVLSYAVYCTDNKYTKDNNVFNNYDMLNDDDEDSFSEDLTEDDKKRMEEVFGPEMFKFLELLDENTMMTGEEQYIGRANKDTYCYTKDDNPYHLFSTKTHYPNNTDSSHLDPPQGCEVIYIWMAMRHGVRYGSPTKTFDYYHLGPLRDKIIKNAGEQKTELCIDDLFGLLLWTPVQFPDNKPVEPDTLTANGYELTKKFGKLLKEKFSHLIPKEYDPNKIKIEYSDEIKANQTVEAITEELFGKPFLPPYNPDSALEMLYLEQCRRPQILDKESGYNYTHLTINTEYTYNMVKEVSAKLGFDSSLQYDDVMRIYDACQYEIAWGHERSPWCSAFTKENLKVMEYIGDIAYYYFCGPGDIYNYFQGCILLKDLFENLRAMAENENDKHRMTMYVGHSTTILLLITQLGLTDDPKLTHKNYFEVANRKWRTSLLAPYTGNVMAVLHRCSSGEKYRVKFLLNGKPFVFSNFCDEDQLCPLQKVYKLFEPVITSEECSTRYCQHTPEEMCKYLKFDKFECDILRGQLTKLDEKLEKKYGRADELKQAETPTEFLFLEKEYRHACVIICLSMIVIISLFCKMSRGFPRIMRRTYHPRLNL